MRATAMAAADYHAQLREKVIRRGDLVHDSHPLRYRAGDWELMRIASADIGPSDRVVVVRGTIHGDEVAGALTVLHHLDELVDRAHGLGLKVVVYPLGNPSGFERGIRYNADHHVGEGNNDFLRYVFEDGSVAGDLRGGRRFVRWLLADEPDLGVDLPLESRLMLSLVRQDPNDQVVAALDLHQDLVTEGLGPCAYHYSFGDLSRYDGIVARVRELVPPLAGFDVAAGFGERVDDEGRVLPKETELPARSDANGFIVRHDGTFSDFYQRIGVPHSVATETSGATPVDVACRVNLTWITGVMELVASEVRRSPVRAGAAPASRATWPAAGAPGTARLRPRPPRRE